MFPTTEAILGDFFSAGYIFEGCRYDFHSAGAEERPGQPRSRARPLKRQRKLRRK